MGGKFKQKMRSVGGIFGFFRKRKLRAEEFEKIKHTKKKKFTHPIRFHWQKSTRTEVLEKKALALKNPNAFRGGKLMRIKFPEKHHASKVGVGYPSLGLVYANLDIARGTKQREVLMRTPSGHPLIYKPLETKIPGPIKDDIFKEYCTRMGIGVYGDESASKEDKPSVALDITAFDLYWEDIRIEREIIIRELRHMPLKATVDVQYLAVLEKSMYNLSRTCYYSPAYSHKNCEDMLHILIWLLNRRNLPLVFHIKVLQCLSLIVYSSPTFKRELVKCGGVRILVRIMQLGMIYCGLQSSWAAYCLTMAAIGSTEVIKELHKIKDIDERVGEMTIHMFWYHWPANFGMMLQSILFGSGGVANSLDAFEFL